MRFLDFSHFGVSGVRRSKARAPLSLISSCLVAGLTGCSSEPARVEDNLTAGRISVVSAPEAAPVLESERKAFIELYPHAVIRLTTRSSSEAVRVLFAAESDLALLSRELEPEERAASVRVGLELEGYRFAKDAVVVVVHPRNPVENVALDEVRRIYQGRIRNWSELGGPAMAIEPVFPDPESDLAEFFVQQVMAGERVETRVVIADRDSLTVQAVRSRPAAIGVVSLAWAERGAKALRLSSLTGLPYWSPDLEAVYDGDYPLTRSLSLYVRADGSRLAHGLITFVTSRDGQKIVHETGLVPTSVPVRFVRRSSLRGAH
jgi:phosphate transport system substrate-binding protein